MSESDIDTQQNVFITPANGGWHYTLMRDWIAVHPALSSASVRLYWIIRSLMHEKGDRSRRLSLDQLAYLMPGVNGKPTGKTRIDDAIRELTTAGLLSNPDGDVQRRWITDPKTGKQTRENYRRWQVHDYPSDEYDGYRSAMEKLDHYSPDWRSHPVDNPEVRKTGSQSDASRPPAKTQKTPGHTETRNSGKTARNSGKTARKTGNFDAHTSENGDLNKPPQPTWITNHPPRARTRENASDDVGGVGGDSSVNGGVLGMVGEMADAMALSSGPGTAGEEQVPSPPASVSRALLERLRAQDGAGLSARAVREFEPLVARLLERHEADDITSHLTSGIRGGGGIRYRLNQLANGKTTIETSDSSSPSPTASPVVPPWCGECEGTSRDHWSSRMVVIEGTRRTKCPQCHPHVAAVAE